MRDVWSLPRNEEIKNSGQEWLFDLLSSVSEDVRNMIIMLTWRIWQLRNDLIHAKGIPPTEVTKRYLTSYFGSLFQIRQQSVTEIVKGKRPCVTSVQPSVAPPRSMSPPWPKPIPGWNALSVDGSFDEEGRAGTGMVLRDSNGSVIFSAHRCLQHCNDVMEAEVSAVMEGLALAHMWSEEPIIIQTDCALVVSAVREDNRNKSVYGHLFEEVKRLISLREASCVKITRDQNRVAHSLANLGRTGGSTDCWVRHTPDTISHLVLADCNSVVE
jgi:ribonuclease HI